MIRKVATIPGFGFFQSAILVILLSGVAAVHAQQPSAQQPAAQPQTQPQPQTQQQPADQSSSQETSEETTPARRKKPPNYKKWSFNAGGGAGIPAGTTNTYVRGGGGVVGAGVARNYSKYFGFRLDVQFNNLPLRTSTLELDSSTAIPGSACNGFFTWWGRCYAGSLPVEGNFLHSSLNQFGVNFGGGITRKIGPNMDFYVEFRYLHAKHDNISTDTRPITVGIRW